jgi:hypothetical protein
VQGSKKVKKPVRRVGIEILFSIDNLLFKLCDEKLLLLSKLKFKFSKFTKFIGSVDFRLKIASTFEILFFFIIILLLFLSFSKFFYLFLFNS